MCIKNSKVASPLPAQMTLLLFCPQHQAWMSPPVPRKLPPAPVQSRRLQPLRHPSQVEVFSYWQSKSRLCTRWQHNWPPTFMIWLLQAHPPIHVFSWTQQQSIFMTSPNHEQAPPVCQFSHQTHPIYLIALPHLLAVARWHGNVLANLRLPANVLLTLSPLSQTLSL
jgi:hypothetical protein